MLYLIILCTISFWGCGNQSASSPRQGHQIVDSLEEAEENETRNEVQQDAILEVVEYDSLRLDSAFIKKDKQGLDQ